MKSLFGDDKRKVIIFALSTFAVIFIGYSQPTFNNVAYFYSSITGKLAYILGGFIGSLLWGTVVGLAYMYLISRQQRNIWQKLKIIMFITFLVTCINSIPGMISSFMLGYISAK